MSPVLHQASVKPLTDHTLVGLVSVDGPLGLELCLDYVQRAGRDAGDEAASRASCTPRRKRGTRSIWGMMRINFWSCGVRKTYRSCCLRCAKASLEDGAASNAAKAEERHYCAMWTTAERKQVGDISTCGEPLQQTPRFLPEAPNIHSDILLDLTKDLTILTADSE